MDIDNKKNFIVIISLAIILFLVNNYINKKEETMVVERANLINSSQIAESNITENKNTNIKKVHISGEINNSGVYEVKENDRLEDLVNLAGGLTQNADLNSINLAMKLEDEMRIIIPNVNNPEKIVDKTVVVGSNEKMSKKININSATKEELMTLPNIGERRADSIIEYRETKKFETIEDIKNVNGIGDKFFEQLKELIEV